MQQTQVQTTSAMRPQSDSLWKLAFQRLLRDRVAVVSFLIVMAFMLMIALSASGLIARDWNKEVAVRYAPPTLFNDGKTANSTPYRLDNTLANTANTESYGISDPLQQDMDAIRAQLRDVPDQQVKLKETLPLGADRWGQDVLAKTIKASETSILVGLISALVAVFIGTALGAISGYFGGWVDDALNWFYNVFNAIPYMLQILAIAAVLQQKGVSTIILILGLTGWTGTYRLVRAEYMKHAGREYVLAAKAIGVSHFHRMFSHILPNIAHVPLVQLSILIVAFIKSEVILSFLGFGVPVGTVSWGSMLNEAPGEFLTGNWQQLVAATAAMAILVTAFSLFTDALRDALDPKIK